MVQVAGGAHRHQGIVVAGTIALKKIGQVQRRLVQQAFADQIQRNQQATDASIAIAKRVDGLELVMADGNADQVWHLDHLVVPKLLQIAHQIRHFRRVGRDEGGILEARAANPVL